MTPYIRNRNCQCVRCRANGLMGAAVLITLGVLFLLESYNVIPFDRSFPVLLLVIGCVLLVARTGSTEGHVQPGWMQAPTAPPPAEQPWTSSAVPPPSRQPEPWASGADNPPSSADQNDSQVKP
ncbi:MAG TPA: DUF5668 domain-containing protein [Alphaproteobacteria bacterium]|nr:DUF5668 domain-containing protein [Alphaproteobacteria bacterium]